jgi:Tfp pilus assembly protein PilO
MTQREKILASCVAGVVVVYGGFKLIESKVYEPATQLTADIQKERDYRDRLQVRLNGAEKITQAWEKYTRQTLSEDPFAAHQAFRTDVGLLLERNSLTEGLKISQLRERIEKKGPRQDFVELPLSVRVTGRLGNLDNFLKDFFQRPYLVRLDKLDLAAEQIPKSRRKKGSSTEPKLSITMTLSTLVLPNPKGVDHPVFDLAMLTDPDQEAEAVLVSAARLRQEDVDVYAKIADPNPFEIYYEPPPPPPPPEHPKQPEQPKVEGPKPPPPPPPDPRRNADKFVLNGVGRVDDGPIAYVINSDESGEPPEEYRLNDEIDDGRLVLIVPEGIVVRTHGHRQPAKNYFYPLGGTFKDREEVNPTEHPQIERQLRVVLKQ